MTNHDNLISERGAEYGESWRETGRFLAEHHEEIAAMGENSFAYVMMHNKLMRALRSPGNKDHYDDLIGYAKLVLSNL